MFCTHCGAQISDSDKFCQACGAKIERPEAPETTPVGGNGDAKDDASASSRDGTDVTPETTLSSSPDGEATSPCTGETRNDGAPLAAETTLVGGDDLGAPLAAETTPSPSPDGEATSPYTGEAARDGADETPETAPTPTPAYTPTPAPTPKKKSHKALWITLICIALALAIAAIVLIVWRPWSRNNAVEEPPVPDMTAEPVTEEPTAEPVAELTPEEAIQAAFAKMNDVDSMHMDLSENVSIAIGIPSVSVTQNMDVSVAFGIDSDKKNGSGRIEGSISAMGFNQSVLAYTETVDGKVMTYTSPDGGATWTQTDNSDSVGGFSNPTASIDLWMNHASNLEKTGTEHRNGFDTTVYAGTLSGEYVKDVAGMMGDAFKNVDEAMLDGLEDLLITLWIDDESGRVVRIALDMQSMMKSLMEAALKESMGELPEGMEVSVDVTKAEAVCDLSQFNEIPPIVIPEEARGLAPEPEPESEPDSIIGTWTLCGGDDEETQQYAELMVSLGMEMVFVFNEDGTGSMSMSFHGEEDKEEFTYTLGDGEIVIEDNPAPYRIEDGLLHLTADEVALVFKRK